MLSEQAELVNTEGEVLDKYRLPVGVRTVTMQGKSLLVNGKPIYIRGVGKHEDADVNKNAQGHIVIKNNTTVKLLL